MKSGVKCAAYLTRHKNRIKASSGRGTAALPFPPSTLWSSRLCISLSLLFSCRPPNWLSHETCWLRGRAHSYIYRYTYEYYYYAGQLARGDLTRDILSSHLDATPFLPFVYLSLFSLSLFPSFVTARKRRETRERAIFLLPYSLISFHIRTFNSFAFPSRLVQPHVRHPVCVERSI